MALSVHELRAIGRAVLPPAENARENGLAILLAKARKKAESPRPSAAAQPAPPEPAPVETSEARTRPAAVVAAFAPRDPVGKLSPLKHWPRKRAHAATAPLVSSTAPRDWLRRFSAARLQPAGTPQEYPDIVLESRAPATLVDASETTPAPTIEAGFCPAREAMGLIEQARRLGDGDEALTFAECAVEIAPELASARFALGSLKIARGDAGGIHHMIAAMGLDPRVAKQACEPAMSFLRAHPETEGADGYLRSLAGLANALAKADRERQRRPGLVERFFPAGLAAVECAAVSASLAREDSIASATVARRRTSLWPDLPAFIVVVDVKKNAGRRGKVEAMAANNRVARALAALGVYGTTCALRPTSPGEHLVAKRIRGVNGAWTYRAS